MKIAYKCCVCFLILLGFAAAEMWAQGTSPCNADTTHNVRVCFLDPPVVFNRCTKQLKPNFYVDLYDWNSRYRYEVNIYKSMIDEDHVATQSWKALDWLSVQNGVHSPPSDMPAFTVPWKTKKDIDGKYIVRVTVHDDSVPKHDEDSATREIKVSYYRNVRAIVVGVSEYQHGSQNPSGSEIANLKYGVRDAQQFGTLLSEVFSEPEDANADLKFKLIPLEGPNATYASLVKHLKGLMPSQKALTGSQDVEGGDDLCEDDLFIFYFSGHTFADNYDDLRWIGTWDIDVINDPGNALTYPQLISYLQPIKANKLIVLDSCFSGFQRSYSREVASAAAGDPNGSKVETLKDGQFRRDIVPISSGLLLNNMRRNFDDLKGKNVLYSAAEQDIQAREIAILASADENGSHVVMTNDPKAQNAAAGHGLYTYFLFRALEEQMAKGHKHTDFAEDGDAAKLWATDAKCHLDLTKAFTEVNSEVAELESHLKQKLQRPTEFASTPLDDIQCRRKAQSEAAVDIR